MNEGGKLTGHHLVFENFLCLHFLMCVFIWWASYMETCTIMNKEESCLVLSQFSACAAMAMASSCKNTNLCANLLEII